MPLENLSGPVGDLYCFSKFQNACCFSGQHSNKVFEFISTIRCGCEDNRVVGVHVYGYTCEEPSSVEVSVVDIKYKLY